MGQQILDAYQENNNLTLLRINNGLQNGGENAIATTLRNCTNLKQMCIARCNITDELLPMVDAIRGNRSLEELDLSGNRIGRLGCDAIAALLEDQNSNLRNLGLDRNAIGNEGTLSLANSLLNNTKLKKLILDNNQIGRSVVDVFSKLLCNTSSINSIFLQPYN